MAKIVPQGYANINAYDEGDNYLQLLQYLDKFGNVYQEKKNEKIQEGVSSLQYLNQLLDEADSPDDISRINNLYKTTYEDLGNLDSPMLSIAESDFENRSMKRKQQFDDFDEIT